LAIAARNELNASIAPTAAAGFTESWVLSDDAPSAGFDDEDRSLAKPARVRQANGAGRPEREASQGFGAARFPFRTAKSLRLARL